MNKLEYSPDLAGKSVYKKGKLIKVRKYHLTDDEIKKKRKEFRESIKEVPVSIKKKVSKEWFNPYTRRGIYYYQIQSLFLLGANTYHSFFSFLRKIKEVMPQWDKFKTKEKRDTCTHKGYIKRLEENFFFFQRINGLNPYGYKLRQVNSSLDIKIESHKELGKVFFYQLSMCENFDKSIPIRDLSGYNGRDLKKYKFKFGGNLV